MVIFNLKLNGSKIFKFFFTCITLFLIFMLVLVTYKVFNGSKNNKSACNPTSDTFSISSKNYANVLKSVHDDINTYVGKKINFTGYVYRVLDLNDNQFVLARNMIISSDFKYVVVGFLCEYDDAKKLKDGVWVNVTGKIIKGDYHGDMPIVKVTSLTTCDKPSDEFVNPPSDDYIPTSTWL